MNIIHFKFKPKNVSIELKHRCYALQGKSDWVVKLPDCFGTVHYSRDKLLVRSTWKFSLCFQVKYSCDLWKPDIAGCWITLTIHISCFWIFNSKSRVIDKPAGWEFVISDSCFIATAEVRVNARDSGTQIPGAILPDGDSVRKEDLRAGARNPARPLWWWGRCTWPTKPHNHSSGNRFWKKSQIFWSVFNLLSTTSS